MSWRRFGNPLAPIYRLSDRLRRRAYRDLHKDGEDFAHPDLGRRGEDLAHRWLRGHGFIVAARNWRPPQGGGEIDIVAWEGPELVFIEVKTRREGASSAPERAIGDDKIHTLRRSARDYMRRSGADPAHARFDVIAIEGASINHLRSAFSL